MTEKSQEKEKTENKSNITHKITVNTDTFEISAPKGTTLKDLLKKFLEQNPTKKDLNLQNLTVMLNGTPIEVKGNELTQNPVLVQGCSIILLSKVTGGF